MSLSQFDSPNIQKIWNNETFDGSDGSLAGMSAGCSVLQPISTNRLNSFDLDSCKENRRVSLMPKKSPARKVKEIDESGLDEEMESIEREIQRLTFRLEELKFKKASLVQKPGKIVPSKFMEPKPFSTPIKSSNLQIGTPESYKSRRRGVSLGPLEILNRSQSSKKPNLMKLEEIKEEEEERKGGKQAKVPNQNLNLINNKSRRRGASLGPLEIQNSSKSAKKMSFKKLEEIKEEGEEKKVPSQNLKLINDKSMRRGASLGPLEIQNSSKSAKKPNFKKLEEIKEEIKNPKSNNFKSFGPKRGVSLGPLEISAITKTPSKHQTKIAKTEEKPPKTVKNGTVGSSSKAPFGKSKPLFDESDKNSVPSRRLSVGKGKSRVVPSRYSLAPGKINIRDEPNSKRRKWSLPGEEGEGDFDTTSSPQSVTKIAATLLPKIKAVRIIVESPRDSGRAKRVADLEGKKPFFSREGVSSYQSRAFG
ncbi:hypothetical protein LUZ60_017444 [Juncus effusus]|nr:hypothetical protein LUZ60_017444 [Juncus effusus]